MMLGIQVCLSPQLTVEGYRIITHLPPTPVMAAKFQLSVAKRSRGLFFHPAPTLRTENLPWLWYTQNSDSSCLSLFVGWRFHAGRSKSRRPEPTTPSPPLSALFLKQICHSERWAPAVMWRLTDACGQEKRHSEGIPTKTHCRVTACAQGCAIWGATSVATLCVCVGGGDRNRLY